MKIKVYLSFVLQEFIVKSKYNKTKIKAFQKDLENFLKKHGRKLLKYIEKYSGFRWKEKEIKIWIFEGYHESIPEPLFLNVYDYDKDFAIFKLVNLLFHQILLQNRVYVFKETAKFEGLVYYFTKKLFENIFKDKKIENLCKKSEELEGYKSVWKFEKEFENIFKDKPITLKETLKTFI